MPLAAYAGEWRVSHVEPTRYSTLHLRVRIDVRAIHVYKQQRRRIPRLSGRRIVLRARERRRDATLEELSAHRIEIRTSRGVVALER